MTISDQILDLDGRYEDELGVDEQKALQHLLDHHQGMGINFYITADTDGDNAGRRKIFIHSIPIREMI